MCALNSLLLLECPFLPLADLNRSFVVLLKATCCRTQSVSFTAPLITQLICQR